MIRTLIHSRERHHERVNCPVSFFEAAHVNPLFRNAHLVLLSLLLAALSACQPARQERAALTALPNEILWAWERPEDLRWAPPEVGVAYVASSVSLADDRVDVVPRANPLKVRPDTMLIPVVHVDASWRNPPTLSSRQRDAIVSQVLRTAQTTGAKVVQLDFEVRHSQQPFLFSVVSDIRKKLPVDRALSITALASWCSGDYWLDAMPADEIVPMTFRMARDDAAVRKIIAEQGELPGKRCRAAAGFATDEVMPLLQTGRRYYFSPVPWKQGMWDQVVHSRVTQVKVAQEDNHARG